MAGARSILRAVRGTAAQVASYIGLDGEIVWNTDRKRPHMQDGATPGGVPISTIGDLTNASAVVPLVVQGTQDGNPTLDQWSAIQAAWNNATALGLPLLLTPGPAVNGILDVRISKALKQHAPNAKLRTDGRVRLHGYAADFTSTSGTAIGSATNIDAGTMVFIGPAPNLPATATVSGAEVERLTLVFHPPVDGTGARVPSMVETVGVYLDRCVRPRARQINVSGLNAGTCFAFASCTNVDFDGITAHDCAMVVDPTSTDTAVRNKQINGVLADDFFFGRQIAPTIGGTVRNVTVYGLTSNRVQKQVDGVNDQGSRNVVWNGMVVRGADEGLDTFGTGSTYIGLDFVDCTCALKVGHGASNNRIEGRSQGGVSAAGDGRTCVLLFAGNRTDTARNRIVWQSVGYAGTRFLELAGDNAAAAIASSGTIGTTKVVGNEVILTVRSGVAARLMSDASTGVGNVVRLDIDDASVAATTANPGSEFLQMSGNALTRVSLKQGQATRPVAPTETKARAMGASPWSGFLDQASGLLRDVVSPIAKLVVAPLSGVSGGAVTVVEGSNPTATAAGNAVVMDLAPNNLGAGQRSAQFVAIDPQGSNQISFEVRLSNGAAPAATLRGDHNGNLFLKEFPFLTGRAHLRPRPYTVANAPAVDAAGEVVFFSNGRKIGEVAGAGSGVVAYFSNGAWRRLSDDTQVTV